MLRRRGLFILIGNSERQTGEEDSRQILSSAVYQWPIKRTSQRQSWQHLLEILKRRQG